MSFSGRCIEDTKIDILGYIKIQYFDYHENKTSYNDNNVLHNSEQQITIQFELSILHYFPENGV